MGRAESRPRERDSRRLRFGRRRPAGPAPSSCSPGFVAGRARGWRLAACALAAAAALMLGAEAAQAKQVNLVDATGPFTDCTDPSNCVHVPTGHAEPGPLKGQITVHWTPATTGATATRWYVLFKESGSTGEYDVESGGASARSHTITGLDETKRYDVNVRGAKGTAGGRIAEALGVTAIGPNPPPTALVSNIGQIAAASRNFSSYVSAQGFTTGSTSKVLTSVDVKFSSAPGSSLRVRIRQGTPGGTLVATLTNPSSLTSGNLTFTAPLITTLAANTTYFVVLDNTTTGAVRLTSSDAEDAGGHSGWSIGNSSYRKASGSWDSSGRSLMIRVKGTAAPPTIVEQRTQALVSNIGQSVFQAVFLSNYDAAQGFTTGPRQAILRSIDVKFRTAPGSDLRVRVREHSETGRVVAELVNPPRAAGSLTFTSPEETVLKANTTYYVVVEGTSGSIDITSSGAEDSGGESGWSVADGSRLDSGTGWANTAYPMLIRVKGVAGVGTPYFSRGKVNGPRTVTLHFGGAALKTGGGCPREAFTVKVNGFGAPIESATCKTWDVVLQLSGDAQAIDDAGEVTVGYDRRRASPALVSVFGVPVGTFTDLSLATGEYFLAPTLSVARVDGSKLTAIFSEPLDAGSAPAGSAFTVSGGRTGTGTVAIDGATATVTLDSAVAEGETVTLSHRGAGWANPLRWAAGDKVPNFRNAAVHNTTGPPSFHRAWTNGPTLVVRFDEPLDAGWVPAPGAFHVTVDDARRDVAAGGVAIRDADAVLTLDRVIGLVDPDPAVKVRYTKPSANWLRDLAGDAAATFTDREVELYQASHDAAAQATGVSVVSDPGADDTYGLDDTIRVRVAFDATVHVTGSPRIAIDLDPADGGTKHAAYASGSGTKALVFTYGVVEPDVSTQGIAVLADTLELNGGAIRSTNPTPGAGASGETEPGVAADLSHAGLAHDPAHKVNWQQEPDASGPSVTGVEVVSDAGDDATYALGETIRVTVTFDEAVAVDTSGGTPALTIDLDPADWGAKAARYESGSGTDSLTFVHTVVEPNVSTRGVAVLADTLALNGGAITSAATELGAALAHDGLAHDPAHKVDWRLSPRDTTPPRLVRGEIDGGTMTLWFSEALDPASTGGEFHMGVEVPETGVVGFRATGAVTVDGEVVTVGLGEGNPRATAGLERNRVRYTRRADGSGGTLRDLAGNPVKAQGRSQLYTPDGIFELWVVGMDLDNVTAAAPTAPAVPAVTAVAVTSDPGADDTYGLGETIEVTVTFGEAVEVTGAPRLTIDMDPAAWGAKQAAYARGSGTTALVFAHTVVEPNYSPRGIAVLADSLSANGGAIRAAGGTDAALGHAGLGHDPGHKVDWRPSISVADASATEGTDANAAFEVSLSRAFTTAAHTVTVDYATADGTATAGEDYTATSGTLTFAAGERTKTVNVPILDDAIDEGEETFTFRLSNAQGAHIGDGEAVGTIANDDPLQKMWLSRFGRTVADHVTGAVSDRLANPLSGAQVTVAGQRVDLAQTADEAWLGQTLTSLAQALGAPAGPAPEDDGWPGQAGAGGWPGTGLGLRGSPTLDSAPTRDLSGRELLLGSAFHLAAEGDGGGPGLAAWGRVTVGGFDGREAAEVGEVRIDGDVTTGILGADAEWDRLLAGVAVSVSEGEGTFDQPGVDSGTIESSMTAVSPYARLGLNDRVSVWGLAGWGTGDMTITQAANDRGQPERVTRTDIEMRLVAAGGRGALMEADETGGLGLGLRADAFYVETEAEPVSNEGKTTANASRVRLALEGSRAFDIGGGVLTPGVEVGLRHDGGDAETGTGVELGGRLSYDDPDTGLSMEARARALLAHEDSDYREWGASGSVRLGPGERGRGLSFSLAPTYGAAGSGVDRLWSARDARGLAPGAGMGAGFEPESRLAGELGYGLGLFGDRFTGTPNVGFGLSDAARDYRIGWRLTSAVPNDPGFEVNLDAMRRESANGNAADAGAEHGLMLRGAIRW